MDLAKLRGVAAQQLFKHGLRSWTFALADTGRRLGCCKYALSRIEISAHYAEHSPEDEVMDTLMHEIAHAIAGPGAGHGPVWKAVAIRLGATPKSCAEADAEVVQKPGDWQAKCPACKKVYNKYKRPRHLTGYRCKCPARCSLTFQWAGDAALKPVVPVTPQEASYYQATCSGCGTAHRKINKPGRALACRCRRGKVLVWHLIQPVAAHKSSDGPTNPPLD